MPAATEQPGQPPQPPRAAGVAGIVFAVLLASTIVLIRIVFPALPPDATTWHATTFGHTALRVALALLPFAAIAFLWFMAALRAYIGGREDKFFATMFLGGGLLFVATLFALASAADLMLFVADTSAGGPPPQLWRNSHHFTFTMLSSYCMRMAAVFTFSTTTIGHRLNLFPRWLVWLGYLVGAILLVVVTRVRWSELAFPFWVLAVSYRILSARPSSASGRP
ncbi:hypothetical protein KZZ52_48995 [Dactylosporangium sp. AC04546]|uniref:hypothetical protein n=1 Tax=Dactylosporangium sp. AC04546 TaxID=2862460 RepID=UPI001EDF1A1D|nr:hypothetical protein [Dactylosporangium sp. AC04546]WVK81826.1 hypothetical protein KZZ52_48995 [Dactylosporangium sp. AC04546]